MDSIDVILNTIHLGRVEERESKNRQKIKISKTTSTVPISKQDLGHEKWGGPSLGRGFLSQPLIRNINEDLPITGGFPETKDGLPLISISIHTYIPAEREKHKDLFHRNGGASHYNESIFCRWISRYLEGLSRAHDCCQTEWKNVHQMNNPDGVGPSAGDISFFLGGCFLCVTLWQEEKIG